MGLFDLIKSKRNVSVKREYQENVFHVVGINYYMENIEKLACSNTDYRKSAKTIANSDLVTKKIYQYNYVNKPVKLVHEPKNKHDKNAIAVYIAGELVGYISRDDNIQVKNILQTCDIKFISSFISGGKYKIVSKDASSETITDDIHIRIKIGYV